MQKVLWVLGELVTASMKAIGPTAGIILAVVAVFFVALLGIDWLRDLEKYASHGEGVSVRLPMAARVRDELISPSLPLEIGYAETDACHAASGALLLRSTLVRRVLLTVDAPLCDDESQSGTLRIVLPENIERRTFGATGYWLERQDDAEPSDRLAILGTAVEPDAGVGAIRLTQAQPWRTDFLINCSDDRNQYSLRTRFPDALFGGSRFEPIASVSFYWGNCLDPRHWPKIDALIDVLGSLASYKERGQDLRR